MHTTTTRKHDTRIILPVIANCTHKIDTLVADKGYDDNRIREALRSVGITPVIPYREQTVLDKIANSKQDKKVYHRRSLNESVNRSIKTKYGEELVSVKWRNQQKEVYMLCILHNIDRQLMVTWVGFQQSRILLPTQFYISGLKGNLGLCHSPPHPAWMKSFKYTVFNYVVVNMEECHKTARRDFEVAVAESVIKMMELQIRSMKEE